MTETYQLRLGRARAQRIGRSEIRTFIEKTGQLLASITEVIPMDRLRAVSGTLRELADDLDAAVELYAWGCGEALREDAKPAAAPAPVETFTKGSLTLSIGKLGLATVGRMYLGNSIVMDCLNPLTKSQARVALEAARRALEGYPPPMGDFPEVIPDLIAALEDDRLVLSRQTASEESAAINLRSALSRLKAERERDA